MIFLSWDYYKDLGLEINIMMLKMVLNCKGSAFLKAGQGGEGWKFSMSKHDWRMDNHVQLKFHYNNNKSQCDSAYARFGEIRV